MCVWGVWGEGTRRCDDNTQHIVNDDMYALAKGQLTCCQCSQSTTLCVCVCAYQVHVCVYINHVRVYTSTMCVYTSNMCVYISNMCVHQTCACTYQSTSSTHQGVPSDPQLPWLCTPPRSIHQQLLQMKCNRLTDAVIPSQKTTVHLWGG